MQYNTVSWSPFTREEMGLRELEAGGTGRMWNVPKVTQQVRGRARLGSQVFLAPSSLSALITVQPRPDGSKVLKRIHSFST